MVLLSVILDFFNSYKSGKVVEKLAGKVSTKVSVLRDGIQAAIDLAGVVPGDILYLAAGNVIPADCRVLAADDFFVNQSSLTGESMPSEKTIPEELSEELTPENQGLVFMGTSVVSGFGTVEVLSTGATTEFGKIAGELAKDDPKTDFEINITKFSLFIMRVVFYMVSFVFFIYIVKNLHHLNRSIILEAFTFALAITLGVTPDMLPAIITVCLSRGSRMMAKKEVIVKQLSSIENFGSMDILCTDKTGTLTQDRITLIKYLGVDGNESEKVLELGHLTSHFHTGVQSQLDNAINDYRDIDISNFRKIDEIPYDFTRHRTSMVVVPEGDAILITKGAPEEILNDL